MVLQPVGVPRLMPITSIFHPMTHSRIVMKPLRILSLIGLVLPFASLSSQQAGNSPGNAALALALQFEAKNLNGRSFDIAHESTWDIRPVSVAAARVTEADSLEFRKTIPSMARLVHLTEALSCAESCTPRTTRPLVIVGTPVDSAGVTRVTVSVLMRSDSGVGSPFSSSLIVIRVTKKNATWIGEEIENVIHGSRARPKP